MRLEEEKGKSKRGIISQPLVPQRPLPADKCCWTGGEKKSGKRNVEGDEQRGLLRPLRPNREDVKCKAVGKVGVADMGTSASRREMYN